LSKILRNPTDGPAAVVIGERHHDPVAEGKAEQCLGRLFPLVLTRTAFDGTKQIPIEEVFKIEKIYNEEKERAYRAGFEEGHQAGHEEGLQKGLDEARRVMQQFDTAIKEAVEQRAALLEEARHRVLQLIIAVSRKVTFDAIKVDQEATAEMVSRVIDQLIDKSRIKVKVHSDHLPVVEQSIDRFLTRSAAIKELTVEADPRVKSGGCFIETPTGDIDVRLSSQFEVIEQAIRSSEEGE
jgi:flagellar assembly protein FliH